MAISDFQLLDTRLSDDDEFVDIYTLRKLAQNFNSLLARSRSGALSMTWPTDISATPPQFTGLAESGGGLSDLTVWLSITLPQRPLSEKLRVTLDAASTSSAHDVYVWPVVGDATGYNQPSDDSRITVTGTSFADYEILVPVHAIQHKPKKWCTLKLYISSEYSSAPDSTGNIIDASQNWWVVDSLPSVGDVVWSTSNTSHEHAMVVATQAVTASTYRIYLDRPMNVLLDGNSDDTFGYVTPARLKPRSLCVMPERATQGFTQFE